MGLAVTGGLDQRGKQKKPEGLAEISRCAQVTGLDMRKSDQPKPFGYRGPTTDCT